MPSSGLISNIITTAYDASVRGSVISPLDYINAAEFEPYIATIDRNTTSVNYTRLISMGVVGVVIEAGYLYNSMHEVQNYQSPRLSAQVEAVQEAGIPFGLYAWSKARSVMEAKAELEELSTIIRTYPPQIGVWLKLTLTNNRTVNNNIVDTYYNEFIELGLKDQIGFYVTEAELSQITWENYYDNWYLWINKHVTSTVDLNQLLTPQFFDV